MGRGTRTRASDVAHKAADRAIEHIPGIERQRTFSQRLRRGAPLFALGAAVMYFTDPVDGRRRRAVTRDRMAAWFRSTARDAERKRRYVEGRTQGVAHKVRPTPPRESMNDATLQQKIQSEVLRDYPTSGVSVNVENGVVVLRGQLDRPEDINRLETDIRRIAGVVDVRSLLHLPNTAAPTWEAATRRG
jgi:hypothetical protein